MNASQEMATATIKDLNDRLQTAHKDLKDSKRGLEFYQEQAGIHQKKFFEASAAYERVAGHEYVPYSPTSPGTSPEKDDAEFADAPETAPEQEPTLATGKTD